MFSEIEQRELSIGTVGTASGHGIIVEARCCGNRSGTKGRERTSRHELRYKESMID